MKLKFFNRMLSFILALILLFSMHCLPTVQTNAVDDVDTYKIKITGVVNENPLSADIFDSINEKRKSAGLASLEMNSSMLDETMIRAAELTIDTSKRNLENTLYDKAESSGNYCYEMILRTTKSGADNIVEQLYNDSANSAAFSRSAAMKVGIGVININGATGTKYICIRLTDNNSSGISMTADEVRKLGNVSKDFVETNADCLKLYDLKAVADKTEIKNNSITLPKGQTKELLFCVTNKTYKNKVYIRPFSCRSSANTVAKDEGYGMGIIRGFVTGTAIITMMLFEINSGNSYLEKITVNVPPSEGETLMETSFTLSSEFGYTYQPVTGKINVKNGAEPYTYSSSYEINGKKYDNRNITFSGDTFTFTPYEVGTNTITIIATGADGRNAFSEPLTYDSVLPMGTLKLKADKEYVALGNSVDITSSVIGGALPLKYKYKYKNGEEIPGTSDTLTLTPTEKGSYTIVATVTDAYNSTQTAEVTFEVVDPIKVSLTADNCNVVQGETAVLTASATGGQGNISYHFTCDDINGKIAPRYAGDRIDVGKFSSEVAGKYTVTVTASDNCKNTGTAQIVINVGEPLSISLKAEPILAAINQNVTLTSESFGGCGGISYSYAYDDGTKISGTGKTVTTKRDKSGTYKVVVTATDIGHHTAKAETQFTVSDSLAVVLTSSKEVINVGDQAVFTAITVGSSSEVQYLFSGASGLTPSGNKVTFKPETAGEYTITVKVTDGGKTATATKTIKVNPRLTVTLSCDDGEEVDYKSGSTKSVYFTAKAQGGTEKKTYKFVCNGIETDMGIQNFIIVELNKSGTVTVKVTVTDENGYTSTAQASVTAVEELNYLSLSSDDEKQMVLGETKEFIAGSKGGYQPVTYTFLCNGSDCINGDEFNITGNKMIFKPKSTGIYTLGLRVTDRKGNTAKINNLKTVKVISEADVLKATVSASSREVLAGNKVTFTVAASGGTQPYKYTYKIDNSSSTTDQATKIYYPRSAGIHTLEVTVTDAEGISVDTSTQIEAEDPMNISVDVSNSRAVIGETVTLSANVTGGFSPLKYTFTEANGAEFKQSGNTVVFTPTAEGTYTFRVYATDNKGNKSSEVSKTVSVKNKLSVNVTATPTTVEVNTQVNIKTVVTGGYSSYKYEYMYSDGTVLNGTSASFTIKPDKIGKYTIKVIVTDSAGNTATATTDLTVTEKLALTVTTDKEMMLVGDKAVLTAKATGGSSSLSYSFTCTSSGVTLEQNGNKATFTAENKNISGYTITVKVTDNNNTKISVTQNVKIKVAKPLTLKLTASSANVIPGNNVIIRASASEGFGSNTFKYSYKNGESIEGTTSSVTITTTKTGRYTVVGTVTDAGGLEATAEVEFTVSDTLGVTVNIDRDKLLLGKSANITATVSGGLAPFTYTYTTVDGLSVSGNKAVFTSEKAGNYTIKVTVKDSIGKTATASKTITVKKPMALKFTVSSPTVYTGSTVTLNTSVSDGFGGVTYNYRYKNGEAIDGNANSVKITTKEPGSYTVVVTATDSGGYTETAEVTFTAIEYNVKLKSQKTSVCVGETVTITAEAYNGVSKSTYTFDTSPEITVGNNGTAVFKAVTTGTYTVNVSAKDTANHTATASIELEVVSNLVYDSNVTVGDKSVETSVIIDSGEKIEINGGATGGSGEYTYYFYYKEINETEWYDINVPSSVRNASIQFNAAGIYKLKIMIEDSDGRTRSKTYTITVR